MTMSTQGDLSALESTETSAEIAGRVTHVSLSDGHTFSKAPVPRVRVVAGLGIEGDAHSGRTVKHRSRVAADPTQPNLRQIHLIPSELLVELTGAGFEVAPGRLGENILTAGLDLLGLPQGTQLTLGSEVVLEVTGLRNPCPQLNDVGPGLMQYLVTRNEDGSLTRRGGIMAIVLSGGEVQGGDAIEVALPPAPHKKLERV